MTMHSNKKVNNKFYLLLFIFILPMIASWLLYIFHDHFHLKTKNHGILLNPPIEAQNIWKNAANHKWQIVYLPATCAHDQCEKMLYTLAQMRKLFGKEYERVALTLITHEIYSSKTNPNFKNEILTENQFAKLSAALAQKKEQNFVLTDKIYLVDPLGNLFMYYPSSVNPLDILKDVKHLLGVSQIG
ncbi:MAG: hypothetical protein ACYCQI_05170 [Gammaproteobacteria bacterium]